MTATRTAPPWPTAWQEDGLIPAPHGEVFEFYRLVDKEAVARLGDEEGMQGPELNLLEPFAKHARLMGRERDVERVREWTEPRLLDAVGDIHRERLAEPFDPHRYPEMQGLAQFQDREAKGIADVFGTDFRRILLCQDQYRRLVYLRVSGEAEPAADGSCTSVIFKESPVGPIVGRNMDSGIGSIAGLQGFGDPVMFRFPEEMGHSYMGTALAVNEHGLTIQGSSIAYAHEQTDAGFWVDLGPLVLRSCSTTAEALDLIDRYSTMSGPSNLVMIDGAGRRGRGGEEQEHLRGAAHRHAVDLHHRRRGRGGEDRGHSGPDVAARVSRRPPPPDRAAAARGTSPTRAWKRCAASCATTRRRRRCASTSTRCRRTIRWPRCTASSWCRAPGSITSGSPARDPSTPAPSSRPPTTSRSSSRLLGTPTPSA